MSDDRIDLSPLDPCSDARFERMVANITRRARAELARRAAVRPSVVELIAGWARPAILIAASIAGVSVALLALFDRSQAGAMPAGAFMPASEVPASALSWYEEDREPTVDDLLVVSSQGGR